MPVAVPASSHGRLAGHWRLDEAKAADWLTLVLIAYAQLKLNPFFSLKHQNVKIVTWPKIFRALAKFTKDFTLFIVGIVNKGVNKKGSFLRLPWSPVYFSLQ